MTARLVTTCLTAVFLTIVLLAGFGAPTVFAQGDATAAAIKARYTKLLAAYSVIMARSAKTDPDAIAFSIKNNMVSQDLKPWLLKDKACAKKEGGLCNLDFDFLFNGQDSCKPLQIVDVFPQGKTYILRVSNRGSECDKQGYYKPYDFTLIDEAGTWVIDDATYAIKDEKGDVTSFTLQTILRGKR